MTIEELILIYLRSKFDCPVYVERPVDAPSKMIIIERTGGRGKWIKESTIAVQSYGVSMYEAASLNDEVIAAMLEIIQLDEITACALNSNYNFTDTTRKEYRYQAVFDITHY